MTATKVALITASSAGLGAQIARVFAADFRVVGSAEAHTNNQQQTHSLQRIALLPCR
jgi:NAD(P)-dependent dehydrogenase (short-subunit alcohol dehydrogenase family)